MLVREFRASDEPYLLEMAKRSGWEYTDLHGRHIEAISVVVDDDERPIMACAAERIIQLYLYVGDGHPAEKLHALRLLHKHLSEELLRRGYHSCEAYVPPQLAKSFGRRLMQTFGWVKNWPSFCKRF